MGAHVEWSHARELLFNVVPPGNISGSDGLPNEETALVVDYGGELFVIEGSPAEIADALGRALAVVDALAAGGADPSAVTTRDPRDHGIVAVTMPAHVETLGESITVAVPMAWAERVRALAPHCSYGPTFRRGVIDALGDVDRCVRSGATAVAYDYLLAAERLADFQRR